MCKNSVLFLIKRPLNAKELLSETKELIFKQQNEPVILIREKQFTFDYVLTEGQEEVYESCVRDLGIISYCFLLLILLLMLLFLLQLLSLLTVLKFIDGYNATILAYGQVNTTLTY